VDTFVLGCTHYPLVKDLVQERIGKRVAIIDSSEVVAESVALFLKANPAIEQQLERNGESHYYVSDVTDAAVDIARKVFGRPINLEKVASDIFNRSHLS
jgi:glutamate racemase